jgi:hypothetical protein
MSQTDFGAFECSAWDAAMADAADAVEAAVRSASQAAPSQAAADPVALARAQEMTPKPKRGGGFKLGELVVKLMGPEWSPPGALHSAEGDAEALLACFATLAPQFLPWVQQNAQPFPPKTAKK